MIKTLMNIKVLRNPWKEKPIQDRMKLILKVTNLMLLVMIAELLLPPKKILIIIFVHYQQQNQIIHVTRPLIVKY